MARKKPGISWHFVLATIGAFIVCLLVLIFFGDKIWPEFWKGKGSAKVDTPIKTTPIPTARPAELDINVYFTGKSGEKLVAEKRHIKNPSTEEGIKTALTELLKGPKHGNTISIPEGTRLISVSISKDIARVNFSSELIKNHPGGSSAELTTIYAIVNTVSLNFPEIKHVQILVDGEPRDTIAGHILISTPIKPNIKLIAN